MCYNLLPPLLGVWVWYSVWGAILSNTTVIIFMQMAFSSCNISLGWIPSSEIDSQETLPFFMALGASPFGMKDCLISPEMSLQPLQSLEETRQLPSKLLHGNSHRSTWFSPGLRSDPGTELTPDQGSGFSIFSLPCFTEGHFLWRIWVSGEGQEGKQEQLPSHQRQRGNTWSLFLPVPCIPRDVCHHFWASQLTERVRPFDPDCAQGPQPGLAQNCATWSRYLSLEYSSWITL